MDTLNSDHLPILTNYKSNINFSKEEIFIPKFNFSKTNWAGFTNDCKTITTKLTLDILEIAGEKTSRKPKPIAKLNQLVGGLTKLNLNAATEIK